MGESRTVYLRKERGRCVLYQERGGDFRADIRLGEVREGLGDTRLVSLSLDDEIRIKPRGGLGEMIASFFHKGKRYDVTTTDGEKGTLEYNPTARRWEARLQKIEETGESTGAGSKQTIEETGESTGAGSNLVHGGTSGSTDGSNFVIEAILGIYVLLCIALAVWLLVLWQDHPSIQALNIVTGEVERTVWSPTNDPVVNFLVNAVVLVVGGAVLVGAHLGILAVALAFLIVLLPLALLVKLAGLSTGGAVVAALIVGGGFWMLFKH